MYYMEDPVLVQQRHKSGLTFDIKLGLACFVAAAMVTFVASTQTTFLLAPKVNQRSFQSSIARAVPQDLVARNPMMGMRKSADIPVASDEVIELPTRGQTFMPLVSFKWMMAAVFSASMLPLIFLYKRWFGQEYEEDEDDDDASIAEEATWAIAAAIGEISTESKAVLQVKDLSGASVGNAEMSLKTAGVNARHVIHRKLVAELANRRQSNAHTKTRAEISYSGKKPYKQKGTGSARRGGNRSPLLRGGGVAFGPRNTRNWKQKVNKKEGRLAISSLIQNRAPIITIVNDLEGAMNVIHTKKAVELINSWKDPEKGDKVLLVVDMDWNPEHPLVLSTRNIPNVRLLNQLVLSVADLLWPNQIFISDKAFEGLKMRFEEDAEEPADEIPAEAVAV